jgi:hypothetical protein
MYVTSEKATNQPWYGLQCTLRNNYSPLAEAQRQAQFARCEVTYSPYCHPCEIHKPPAPDLRIYKGARHSL